MAESKPQQYALSLFEVGDVGLCLFSYFCPNIANAYARSLMDGSSFFFNLCCLNPLPTRLLFNSAYNIKNEDGTPKDCCTECLTVAFCLCCSTNQMLQTAKANGKVVNPAHKMDDRFINSATNIDAGACCYAFWCGNCANGSIMEDMIKMNWFVGCLCTNMCVTHNIARYHYGIKGNDVVDECLIPGCVSFCMSLLLSLTGICWCCCWPCILAFGSAYFLGLQVQTMSEVKSRGGSDTYILGGSPATVSEQQVPQQTVYVQQQQVPQQPVYAATTVTEPQQPVVVTGTTTQPVYTTVASTDQVVYNDPNSIDKNQA